MIKTVLFDLDDTIFDYKHSRLCGLDALKNACPQLSRVPLEDMEAEHEALLNEFYTKVLDGALTDGNSRLQRMRLLFKKFGADLREEEAAAFAQVYKQASTANLRAVSGVRELLDAIKKQVQIGIVTNGMYESQTEKIRVCRVEGLYDFLILSEEVGSRKPDKAIFEAALQKSGSAPNEAVFIGDAWETDMIGAANCGIKAVWLNRYNKPCPNAGLVYEIKSFEGMDGISNYILK